MKRDFPSKPSRHKIVNLKGRRGGKGGDLESLPSFEPTGAGHKGWKEGGTDKTWTALRHYLTGKIGAKWDDIYSEVCHTHKRHIKEVLAWMVEINTFIDKDGDVAMFNRFWRHGETKLKDHSNTFYVDPRGGVLGYTPIISQRALRRVEAAKPQPWRLIKGQYYISVLGLWYGAAPVETNNPVFSCYHPAGDEETIDHGVLHVKIGHGTKAVIVRRGKQLNSKELKKLGLTNKVVAPVAADEQIRRAKERLKRLSVWG